MPATPLGGAAESIPSFLAMFGALSAAAFLHGITFSLPFWGEDADDLKRAKVLSQDGRPRDPFDEKMLIRDRWIHLERSTGTRKQRYEEAQKQYLANIASLIPKHQLSEEFKKETAKYDSFADKAKLSTFVRYLYTK